MDTCALTSDTTCDEHFITIFGKFLHIMKLTQWWQGVPERPSRSDPEVASYPEVMYTITSLSVSGLQMSPARAAIDKMATGALNSNTLGWGLRGGQSVCRINKGMLVN